MPDSEASITALAQELADKGLTKYLEDADLQGMAAKYLAEELNLPPLAVRTGLSLLAPVLVFGTKKSGKWLSRVGGQRLKELAFKVPGMAAARDKIGGLLAKLDREAAAKREVDEILAGKRPPGSQEFGNYLSLDLKAAITNLEKQDDIISLLGDFRSDFERFANPQPAIRLLLPDPRPENRFVYTTSLAPFFGRGKQLKKLKKFLDSDADFTWLLIYGPGGLGKSRLALELCRARGGAWRTGFLKTGKEFDWDRWQPEQPTLMIVDYAAGSEKIHDIALTLAVRDDLDCPVRILLLERDMGDWYDRKFLGTGNERAYLEQYAHDKPQLLKPLDDDAVRSMMRFYLGRHVEEKELDSLFSALKEIDDPPRPLFAAFVADAYSNGNNPRGWDKERLITDILKREENKLWRPAGVTEHDKCLLALATICGGISTDVVRSLPDRDFFLEGGDIPAERYKAMCGRPVDAGLAPLEPDILGELFVLDLLTGVEAGPNRWHEKLHRSAWEVSPSGTPRFLNRLAVDFPEHKAGHLLYAPAFANKRQLRNWSLLAVNLVDALGNKGQAEEAEIVHNGLTALVEKQKGGQTAGPGKGKAGFTIRIDGIKDGEIILSHGQLGKTQEASATERAWAMASVNFITVLGRMKRLEKAQDVYDALADLAQKHKGEPEIRLTQARGAFNLIIAWKKAGNPEKAQEVHDALANLAQRHKNEPEIRLNQANGAINLISAWGDAGKPEKAQEVYDALADLAQKHEGEPEIRLALTKGTFHMAVGYYTAGERDQAGIWFGKLRALAKEYPDQTGIQDLYAKLRPHFEPEKQQPNP